MISLFLYIFRVEEKIDKNMDKRKDTLENLKNKLKGTVNENMVKDLMAIIEEAYDLGREEGYDLGYEEGFSEAENFA